MKKKLTLNFQPELEFTLLGISSHENDYHLSWVLNQKLGLEFIKASNLVILQAEPELSQEFSVFNYEDEDALLMYNLISNKCEQGYLVPELKNIDFFMQISGEINHGFLDQLIEKLRSSGVVNASFVLDPKKIKAAEKLILH
ncbi:MAG: IPExxxVDY family protein [Bacteroidota bacterium]|nr:IPExxxVDY family protein [Bacteroidota bacterium]